MDVDGYNFLPAVRDEIHNLHSARDDSRDDSLRKNFSQPLENFYRHGGGDADNLSADILFCGVAVDGR